MPVAVSPECPSIFSNKSYICSSRCQKGYSNNTELAAAIVGKEGFSSMLVLKNHAEKVLMASFRSSDGWDNWIYDSMMWKVNLRSWRTSKYPPKSIPSTARVHFGLVKTYNLMRIEFLDALRKEALRHPTYKIMFLGLSLGAAEALLAMADYQDQFGNSNNMFAYTYGTPRIYNKHFQQHVNSLSMNNIYRIASFGDPVTVMPAKWLGYYHVGRQFLMKTYDDGDSVLRECGRVGTNESPDCYHGVWQGNPLRHYDYYKWAGDC